MSTVRKLKASDGAPPFDSRSESKGTRPRRVNIAVSVFIGLILSSPARAVDYKLIQEETRKHLKALVALDTSNPPGNEIIAAEYLKKQLDAASIKADIYTSSETRASVIARIPGTPSEDVANRRPLLLMCHTDVVPADPKEWTTDPFVPTEKDGYLYGRGTADIKCMCAAELAVMFALKRATAPLNRDVVFFAEADEESGAADRHIDWLLKNYGDALDARYGVNEGGNTIWDKGGVVELRVQAAEKEYMDLTLKALGSAGHASVPRGDNAVAAVARAVAKLADHRFSAEVNPVVRGFLERQLETAEPQLKAAIDQVLKAKPGLDLDDAADRLAALNPEFGAILRDTVSPTILKAGYKGNVIPAEATAVLNARLMPGRDPQAFLAEVGRTIDNPLVQVLHDPLRPPVPAMPTDTAFYRAVEEAAKELSPKVRVMPFMAAWTTDSQNLRARQVVMYGIDPPLTLEDGERIHGKDERLALDALDWYAKFLYNLVVKLALQ